MFSSPDGVVAITTGVIKSRPYFPNGRLLQITTQDQSQLLSFAVEYTRTTKRYWDIFAIGLEIISRNHRQTLLRYIYNWFGNHKHKFIIQHAYSRPKVLTATRPFPMITAAIPLHHRLFAKLTLVSIYEEGITKRAYGNLDYSLGF